LDDVVEIDRCALARHGGEGVIGGDETLMRQGSDVCLTIRAINSQQGTIAQHDGDETVKWSG